MYRIEDEIGIKTISYGYEVHPFDPFIVDEEKMETENLIVGTFPPHRFCIDTVETQLARDSRSLISGDKTEIFWFYGSGDNKFWKNLEDEFNVSLRTKEEAQEWCKRRKIGFMDLFHTVQRYRGLASDSYVTPIKVRSLTQCLIKYPKIKRVFFTSDLVMNIAKKEYLEENFYWLKKNDMPNARIFNFQDRRDEVELWHLSSPSPNNQTKTESGWDFFKSCITKNNYS